MLLACVLVLLPQAVCAANVQERSWDSIVRQAEQAIVEIRTEKNSGTGFVISPEGHMLTAAHVVVGASSIWVQISGRPYSCRLVLADYSADIALLQVHSDEELDWLPLGDVSELQYGQELVSLGFPLPQAGVGLIAVVGSFQGFRSRSGVQLLQHTCPVDAGHSGGPTVDSTGRVVGLVTEYWANYSEFAISVSMETIRALIPRSILPETEEGQQNYDTHQYPADARVSEYTFEVSAADPSWQPTGLYVESGTDMVFRAYGEVIFEKEKCYESTYRRYVQPSSCPESGYILHTCDPDGARRSVSGGRLSGSLPENALVGRLDRSPYPGFEFQIGSARSVKADFSGYLCFGMNDSARYIDNEGSWIVELTLYEYE